MKRYTLNDREVAIQLAKDRSCKYAAEHLRIPLATILKWMKEYVPGFLTPRRQAHEDEREIREWVLKQRDNDQPVTKEALREYARKVVSKPEFDASDAWLKAFLKRHDLKNAVLSTCEAGSGKRVSRGNYKRYTLEQRKEAVQMTASRTNTQASGQLQIPTSTINGWKRRCRSGFVDVKGNTGKTFTYDESIDYNIRDWILKKRDENTQVTRAALREYARKAVNQPRFKASEGWLRHFLRRHDLLKVVTCSSRQCTKHCNFGSHCFSETAKADGSKKPYVCKICGKGFAHPSRLKRHVAIHKS